GDLGAAGGSLLSGGGGPAGGPLGGAQSSADPGPPGHGEDHAAAGLRPRRVVPSPHRGRGPRRGDRRVRGSAPQVCGQRAKGHGLPPQPGESERGAARGHDPRAGEHDPQGHRGGRDRHQRRSSSGADHRRARGAVGGHSPRQRLVGPARQRGPP
ncbi:unnamed protein product, partial [Effrenium voratum]